MKRTGIKHAIQAKFYFKKDKDYVVNDGIVRIVDYQNTGGIQSHNNQWEKGLHQFIQLKHNLSVTPLSITTNYLSNVTFFQRYKQKLLGLTGTLGSLNTQNLLAKQYKVDFIIVPPFKQRILKEEYSKALQSEEEWLNEIKKAVQEQMSKKRAVLLINKTIQEAEKVQKTLQGQSKNIIKYTDDSQVISKEIGPNGIVIATNLAGRGTDFITNKELEENGGLHVIMSFLPQSIRTQEQGFGRTCRQGKKGSAQLIVQFKQNLYTNPSQKIDNYGQAVEYCQQCLKQNKVNLIDVVKFFRDENEKYYMDQIEIEMTKLLNEDKCFDKFCQIAKKKTAFRSLEEKWGLYLEINQDQGIQINEIENFLNQDDNQNPKYLILEGLEQHNLEKINKADQEKKDPQAQYYKGLLELDNQQYQQGYESLILAKQLFESKIENERGFATAIKINQQQIQKFEVEEEIEQKKVNFQLENFEKLESGIFQSPRGRQFSINEIKRKKIIRQNRFSKVIDNIDEIVETLKSFDSQKEELELDWVNVLSKDEQEIEESESEIKDQKEVINDGPLPRLGKVKKVEKETSFWEYAGLFGLGIVQFAIGAVISVYSLGAAMPLAKTLIKNGISDMVLSVTSCIKGTPIDWENWRKKKLIDYSEALLLAGPEGIREAIDIGGNAMKSIKKEGFVSFISQLGDVSQKQLQIIGSSLTNDQKQSIENSNQTLQDVSKIACLNLNYQELQQMASEIIQDQVIYGTISQETGNEINELLTQSVNQVQQTNGSLKDAFVSFGAKYLKAQIGKKKVEQLNEENQEETIQKIKSDCQTKYNAVKDQIDNFQEYKERLTNELNQFSKILWNCFQSDIEIQKQIIIIDLFFEIICDFQKVQNQVNDTKLQEMIRQNFSIHNKTFQQCCQNLQISNKQQMVQFYNERINPIIKRIVHHFLSQIKFTEPLEIVIRNQINEQMTNLSTQLNQQKNNLEGQQKQIEQFDKIINNHGTQQQYDQFNQMVNAFNQQHQQYTQIIQQSKEINQQRMYEIANQLIQHLVQKQMIVGNGLSVKDSGMEEFNQFSASRIPNPLIKNLIGLALQDSIQNGLSKYQCGKRFFSNLLKSTIQLQVLDEIKSYIFKQRLQQVEQSVMKEFD